MVFVLLLAYGTPLRIPHRHLYTASLLENYVTTHVPHSYLCVTELLVQCINLLSALLLLYHIETCKGVGRANNRHHCGWDPNQREAERLPKQCVVLQSKLWGGAPRTTWGRSGLPLPHLLIPQNEFLSVLSVIPQVPLVGPYSTLDQLARAMTSFQPLPPPPQGCPYEARLFVSLRTALKDSPQGPPTANRQPPTATNRQSPTATNHQPPPTANRQPLK